MTESHLKRGVVAALSHTPDFSGLQKFPAANSNAGQRLLRWMDRSGLALRFFDQVENRNIALSADWRAALGERFTKNIARTRDLFDETQQLAAAFRSFGVTAATLKGFTLTPDFCPDPNLRHQVDFDLLVASSSVRTAAEALRSCGYSTDQINEGGETCFLTPLTHIPSPDDDLYGLQRQRQVDLHVSLFERSAWFPIEGPQDCLERARPQIVEGMDFLSLSLEDKFLLQVLHAFRHSFRSWVRVSWLLEIATCMETHQHDATLWNAVIHRAGETRLAKSVFAFVLGLIERLFQTPIPTRLQSWTEEAMSVSLRAWLDHFAFDWATSDWPGSLNNLFLAPDFISDEALRRQYWQSRLVPRKAQTSIGSRPAGGAHSFFQWQAARLRYVAQRVSVHLKDIVAFPWQGWRWKRALAESRRLTFHTTL
jgi:hypothetical protein